MKAEAGGVGRRPGLRGFWASLDRGQRRTLVMMALSSAALHVVGFVTLIALVAPHHYHARERAGRSRSGSA